MIVFIESIPTPYLVARFNVINKVFGGKIVVLFQASGDINRHWKQFPKIKFKYKILTDFPLRLGGKDIVTLHINTEILSYLSSNKRAIKRVVCCGWDTPTLWLATLWSIQNKVPYTIWAGSTEYELSWRRTVTHPLVKWIVAHADSFICYGKRSHDYQVGLGAESHQIDTFINSIDTSFFKLKANTEHRRIASLRRKFDIPQNSLVFLYVGQLIERKGVGALVESFASLLETFPNIQLVVVGKGPLEKDLKAPICQKFSERVTFIGHVEYNELPSIYAMSDVFILPSVEEVWGLVVNEAMACGLPVLVSKNAGCVDDLVLSGVNGYVFTPSALGISNALKKVASLPSSRLKKMGRESLRIISRHSDLKSARLLQVRWGEE